MHGTGKTRRLTALNRAFDEMHRTAEVQEPKAERAKERRAKVVPSASSGPQRLGLADLKAALARRKEVAE
jgi:hypothetical protein